MNWIQKVLEASDEAETPKSFIYWSAVAAISATASNHVYMNRKGIYQLRPNVFIMLMAKSGLGKGFPVNIAKKLVTSVNCTRVISGRSSIQALVRDMAVQATTEKNPKPMFQDSRAFFPTSEFATSLVKDESALTTLTDLYDCHWNEEWATRLITRAGDEIVKPNLTLLSGSSPSHFFDTIPEANITGGFVGRLLIVYEEKRSKINPLLSDVEGEEVEDFRFPYDILSDHLKNLYETLKIGESKFRWTHDAGELWKAWYSPFRTTENEDKTGFKERMPDHVLKVAMCLSMAECTDLIIRSSQIEEAIEVTSTLGYATKRVSEGKGKDPLAPQAKIILDFMLTAPNYIMSRSKLLQKGYGDFDSVALDRIMDGIFIENGWVVKERTNEKGKWDWKYAMTDEAIRMYKKGKGD